MDKVSVIIPTYNRFKYLLYAIKIHVLLIII